jgi:Hypothetical protein (DUF2513)
MNVRIDQDYLKRLLQVCADSNEPTFDIEELKSAGFDYDDRQFEFHMMILTDQGFIERDDRDPGFGLVKSADGFPSWAVLPLRLTASGHRFVEALSNKEVWAAIKQHFPDASIDTLEATSIRLLANYSSSVVNNIVHNTTNIGTAHSSPVQQGGIQSTQNQTVSYNAQTCADLTRLVSEFADHLHELKLDKAAVQKANAQIATIVAQLGDEPNPTIIKQAGRTLRNVTEGAIGSLLASAAPPTAWREIAEIIRRLFS